MKNLLSTLVVISFLCGSAPTFRSDAAEMVSPKLQSQIDKVRDLIGQGKIVEALQEVERIQKSSPEDPDAKFAVGEILQELGALRAEQLQRVAPDSPAAHELLGKSLESRGKLEQALAEYRRALQKNPTAPGLHFLVGNAEWKLHNIGPAEAEFREELKLNPHHAMANLRMGQIVLDTQRDEPGRAVAYLQEATADAKSSLDAHRELGKALRLDHKFQEALKELQLVASRRPNDDSVHAQLAAVYKEIGDPERARQELEIHRRILKERLQASEKIRAEQAH